ncbi:MAG TPA: hypothetical protein VHN78_03285 [Chloroflexota bacterium]|nr:hypothetical protein [Chloroflexota bacterium]
MTEKTGMHLSARRPAWKACACALMALLASLLVVPAASAIPASGAKSGAKLDRGQMAPGPKTGRGPSMAPVQLNYEFLD